MERKPQMRRGYNDYQKAQAITADSGELLLMLFDGAIRFTNQAIDSMGAGDVPGKCEAISRAFAIVAELHGTLDFELCDEIAGNLASLYFFILENYCNANIRNDVHPLKDVLSVLSTLREGWIGAIQQVRKGQVEMGKESIYSGEASSLSVLAG
jgi:flagellar protein FliS